MVRQVAWSKPTSPSVKVNVDGSYKCGDLLVGFGGVIRDHEGRWKVGFSGQFHSTSVLLAELLGLKQGLMLAWDHGYRDIQCETDSMESYRLVTLTQVPEFHSLGVIIQQVRDLLRHNWRVTITHIWREGNVCADILAKMGSVLNVPLVIYDSPPQVAVKALEDDAMGRSFSSL